MAELVLPNRTELKLQTSARLEETLQRKDVNSLLDLINSRITSRIKVPYTARSGYVPGAAINVSACYCGDCGNGDCVDCGH